MSLIFYVPKYLNVFPFSDRLCLKFHNGTIVMFDSLTLNTVFIVGCWFHHRLMVDFVCVSVLR